MLKPPKENKYSLKILTQKGRHVDDIRLPRIRFDSGEFWVINGIINFKRSYVFESF